MNQDLKKTLWAAADKLRASQEAAAQAPATVRVPRERKVLPPVDPTPMQQVETHKDA